MTGRFPPVTRTGGKRAVADHILDIVGEWPLHFVMVDADPAIADFWRLAFAGRLRDVAEVIRTAHLDGEGLWLLWSTETVPDDEVERVARWIVLQKGNFSGKPVSWDGSWSGLAGVVVQHQTALDAGYGERFTAPGTSSKVDAIWSGLSGYATLSQTAVDKGFSDRFTTRGTADRVDAMRIGTGRSIMLDLAAEMPDFGDGDLVLFDPPYRGTTGFGSWKLDRERVVEIAVAAHEAGARVAVHEAEPILATVMPKGPWRHVELERRHGAGQRTWSKQQREVLTLNFEPAGRIHHSTKAPRVAFSVAPEKQRDEAQRELFG